MSRIYQRRSIHNLTELDTEQERIRSKARRIEKDILGTFSPGNLAIHAASMLLGSLVTKEKKSGSSAKSSNTLISSLRPGPKTKNRLTLFAKKAGSSFLKWQAFNLALYLGGKAIKMIRENRRQKKVCCTKKNA